MIDAAVMFGANRTRAEKEMTEVLQFEIDLANVISTNRKNSHFFRSINLSLGFSLLSD